MPLLLGIDYNELYVFKVYESEFLPLLEIVPAYERDANGRDLHFESLRIDEIALLELFNDFLLLVSLLRFL